VIGYGRQTIEEIDIQEVVKTLNSDWLTQGPKIEEFEVDLAEYCGAKYSVVVSSGTAALHLANLAMGTKIGDKVITSPISFLASSNSVVYVGGIPIFADICKSSFNVDPAEIRKQIKKHPETKGIIPIHFAGLVTDIEAIYDIAKQNNLWIIEDACHSFGGNWSDSNGAEHRVGDCTFSDMTIFSFHPVKHITTGEGGAILTNNKNLYEKLLILRNHGITKKPEKLMENHGGWYYELHELGFNYRITAFQAALGIQQLKKSYSWQKKRRNIVAYYDEAFKSLETITPQIHPDKGSYSYHLYVVQAENRKELYNYLRTKEIYTQVHYIPIHLQPFYKRNFNYNNGDYPIAEQYYEKALSLPLYPSLSEEKHDFVIESIFDFYGKS